MNIFKLSQNFLEITEMIADGCPNEALIDTLESIECAVEVKAENTVYVIENSKANREVLASVINRLQIKLQAIDNNITSIENNLFSNLEAMGISTIKAGIFTIKQVKNPPSVLIEDESLIPASYQTVIPESYKINKKEIADYLKMGLKVPGARLQQSKRWKIS
jgi:hypothetical protein